MPVIRSDYPNSANVGEIGATLGLNCVPSYLADGAYTWTENDVLVTDAGTYRHVITIPNGTVNVRLVRDTEYQQLTSMKDTKGVL